MDDLKIISQQLLDNVSAAAQSSPRQRKNFNFHQRDDQICHRLLNAIEPDTYIRPIVIATRRKAKASLSCAAELGCLFFPTMAC